MKTKIIIGIGITILVIIIAIVVYSIWGTHDNTFPEISTGYSGEEAKVEKVYLTYLSAGEKCDIPLTESIVTERTKEIVHYTCQNMADEVKCYVGRNFEVRVKDDTAVVYLIPFSHKIENPFFFAKENGEWKIDLYKMSNGLVMGGSTCDSGWGWRNEELADEFCNYFEEGKCSDE